MKAAIKVSFSSYRNVNTLYWHILQSHFFFLFLVDHINLYNIIAHREVYMQL